MTFSVPLISEKTFNPLPAARSAAQPAGSCLLWVLSAVLFDLPLVCFFPRCPASLETPSCGYVGRQAPAQVWSL